MANFFRRFIPNIALIATRPTRLRRQSSSAQTVCPLFSPSWSRTLRSSQYHGCPQEGKSSTYSAAYYNVPRSYGAQYTAQFLHVRCGSSKRHSREATSLDTGHDALSLPRSTVHLLRCLLQRCLLPCSRFMKRREREICDVISRLSPASLAHLISHLSPLFSSSYLVASRG